MNVSIKATLGTEESGRCRDVAVSGGSTVVNTESFFAHAVNIVSTKLLSKFKAAMDISCEKPGSSCSKAV